MEIRTWSLRLSLLLVIVALTGVSTVRPSLADGPDQVSLGIAPLDYDGQYFDLTMAPGESRVLKVEIANHGAKQIAARTYAANAYTIIDGGFGARLDGEPVTGTTSWLAYPAQTIDLPAGMGLTQTFTVTVPANAGPGEYITSLAVQNAEPTAAGSGGVVIKQVQRQVIAVAITVPGPRKPELAIGSVEHKYLASNSVISATLSNTGNVRLKPSGELVVSELDGREVSRLSLTMDSFYAGDTTTVEAPFEKALLPGDYRVTLTLNYEGGPARTVEVPLNVPRPTQAEAAGAPTGAGQTATVSQPQPAEEAGLALPLLLVATGVALALVAALIILRLRRWRSGIPGSTGPGRPPRGGPAPAPDRGVSQLDASRAAARAPAAPPPTPLRYPLAKAAGEREEAPLRPSSPAQGPRSGPRPGEPQDSDGSTVGREGDASPPPRRE